MPIKLSDSPAEIRRSPLLGEHTEEILGEVRGYSDEQIDKLDRGGAFRSLLKKGTIRIDS